MRWIRQSAADGHNDREQRTSSPDVTDAVVSQAVARPHGEFELLDFAKKKDRRGYLSRDNAGNFNDAVALAAATGGPADINAVRAYTSRPGVSFNMEQQVNDKFGLFFRAGWADGNIEPWDFTDIDRTVSGGVSINGRSWGRPDDTIGIAGVVSGISSAHVAFLNAGGLGILIGDGQLTNYGLEKIFEAHYSYYALNSSTKVTFDYQFIANPGYNADRGPANVLAGRVHWQF